VTDLEIRQSRFGAPAAQTLIAAAQADLASRYGDPDQGPIEAMEFDPPEGGFYVAYLGGEAVACGGWRTLGHFEDDAEIPDDVAEIKRMYARPTVRGTGAAAALLTALEEAARAHGMRRMVLETGLLQPEAMRFYEKNGYVRIPPYGFYKDEPDCVCYERGL
jgi:GNAT superfamily N-acetyltransferase